MDADNKEQRRQDVMERLRIRFSQYQKRQNEYLTRFMTNGPVKEERERQDTQMYQQRILNTRANTKPRPKQDQAGKNSTIDQAYPPNAMGDTLILQQLKRRFDETFNQAQEGEDFEDRGPTKTSRAEEDQRNELAQYQQGNVMNSLPRTMQLKNDQNDLTLVQNAAKKNSAEENVSSIPNHNKESGGDVLDGSKGNENLGNDNSNSMSDSSKIVSSNCHITAKAGVTVSSVSKTEPNVVNANVGSASREKGNNILQNGVSHIANDGNLTDMFLKGLENDFEDMLQNISDTASSAITQTTTSSTIKTASGQAKTREKKENKNVNNNVITNSMSHVNDFPPNTNVPHVNNLGNAPPYPNSVGGMQMRPQAPTPMGLRPQTLRHLVDHIQGRGRQQVGPGPYRPMTGVPVRENLVTGTQTKNPETMAKVQEHLLFKKQMQQRQMEMEMRQQMQQQMQQSYQQPTYQQQLMQMAQAAQQQQQQHSPSPMSPMIQSMSPHMQQQAFMQQNMNSPVPSPMSTTPLMNRNPFQFPQDYSTYMNQQKQMQGFDGMNNMQSQHDGGVQMPMSYYQTPQQEPAHYQMRQPVPNQGTLRPAGMQSAAIRAMMTRERMLSPDSMPPGQMMQGQVGPPGSFQPQVPKPPPPQYTQNNFSPPNIPLERPQLQRSMSHPRNRLSHFSHPDEVQSGNAPTSAPLKSPGTLPMYPNVDNMYQMGQTGTTMTNGGQQNSNSVAARMSENNFSNFQNYGPPNMSLANAMSSRTRMSPNNWTPDSQLQKQQTLHQMHMNMSSEYRMAMPKGPSVNLTSRANMLGQTRRTPAHYNSGIEKHPDVPNLAPNSMMSSQQGLKLPGGSLKQEPPATDIPQVTQGNNPSDDLESILSDPPENFDLVKLLG
eukprot:gene842-10586_t